MGSICRAQGERASDYSWAKTYLLGSLMGYSCSFGESSALSIFPKPQQKQARPCLCPGMKLPGAKEGTVVTRVMLSTPLPHPHPGASMRHTAVPHFREKDAGPGGSQWLRAGTPRVETGRFSGFHELRLTTVAHSHHVPAASTQQLYQSVQPPSSSYEPYLLTTDLINQTFRQRIGDGQPPLS